MQATTTDPYGFAAPQWDAPFDTAREIADVPTDATVRGMFFDFVIDRVREVTRTRLDTTTRLAFGRYPMREYLALLVEGAELLHPGVSTREALRRVGESVFEEFCGTMFGRAIFSVAGRNMERIVALAPKAYDVSYSPTIVQTHMTGQTSARVSMTPMFVFPDTFHVGAWEGAGRFCGITTVVRIQKSRPGFAEYDIRW